MRRYQAAYREHMIGLGYEVEKGASARSTESEDRPGWGRLRDQERIAEVKTANAALMFADAAQARDQTKAAHYLANDARKDAKLYLDAAKRDAATIRSEAEQHAAERQADLDDTEAALETMARSLESRKANVADREAKAKTDALAAAEDRQKAADARARDEQAEREHQQARAAELALLRALPPDMDWWLDRPLKGGGTRRDIFLRDTAKRRETFSRFEAKTDELERKVAHDDAQPNR